MDRKAAIQVIESKLGSLKDLAIGIEAGAVRIQKSRYSAGAALTLAQKRQLRDYAHKHDMSESAVLKEALKEYYAKRRIRMKDCASGFCL
jgi:hypothetical protein